MNNRGAGLATPVPPATLALRQLIPGDELPDGGTTGTGLRGDDGAADAIETEFQRRVAALRRLRPWERAAALRQAREQRDLALRQLREERRRALAARHRQQHRRLPEPV